jgi:hypothetical protein
VKLLDETKNNNTTASNDSELTFQLDAGGKYNFQFYIMNTTSSNGDFKTTVNYNGTSTIRFGTIWKNAGTTTLAAGSGLTTTQGVTTTILGSGGPGIIEIKGGINCTTAGTLGFGWAQQTSDAGPTTVFANSYGLIFKVN